MRAYIQLLRPLNCMMVAVAVFIGALVAGGLELLGSALVMDVGLACLAAFLFTGAGNSLNDYFDREIDRTNHPSRPIPSGRTQPESALILAAALFTVSVIIAFFINLTAFIIVILNLAVMLSYEVFSKAKGIAGNMTISWLTGTTFLFGGAAAGAYEKTLVLTALAFLATLGREIAKDIKDVKGDIGRLTFPMKVGDKKAGRAASVSLAAAVVLSPFPPLMGLFSGLGLFFYIAFIALTDAIFIYCIYLLLGERMHASSQIKYGMLTALLAFLIGVVLNNVYQLW